MPGGGLGRAHNRGRVDRSTRRISAVEYDLEAHRCRVGMCAFEAIFAVLGSDDRIAAVSGRGFCCAAIWKNSQVSAGFASGPTGLIET